MTAKATRAIGSFDTIFLTVALLTFAGLTCQASEAPASTRVQRCIIGRLEIDLDKPDESVTITDSRMASDFLQSLHEQPRGKFGSYNVEAFTLIFLSKDDDVVAAFRYFPFGKSGAVARPGIMKKHNRVYSFEYSESNERILVSKEWSAKIAPLLNQLSVRH